MYLLIFTVVFYFWDIQIPACPGSKYIIFDSSGSSLFFALTKLKTQSNTANT